jgi:YjbE family integral membrane protein
MSDTALAWEILEIVWINILLSGDNAILIALACRALPEERRRWGVTLGALGGVLLRIAFTLVVVELMSIPLLKGFGALLLLGLAIKLPLEEVDHSHIEAKSDLLGAVVSILVADAVMSLDNVIAIAAAAHGSMRLIVFGLALSAPIVMFGAGFLLKLLDRFPMLIWVGAGVLGWVAGDLAAGDPTWERLGLSGTQLETPMAASGCGLVLAIGAVVSRLGARAPGRET